jgi:hypothetical protein
LIIMARAWGEGKITTPDVERLAEAMRVERESITVKINWRDILRGR